MHHSLKTQKQNENQDLGKADQLAGTAEVFCTDQLQSVVIAGTWGPGLPEQLDNHLATTCLSQNLMNVSFVKPAEFVVLVIGMNAFDLVSYACPLIMNGVNLYKWMFKLTYMFYRVVNT